MTLKNRLGWFLLSIGDSYWKETPKHKYQIGYGVWTNWLWYKGYMLI